MTTLSNSKQWYQLSLKDSDHLSGKSVLHFLTSLQRFINIQSITIDDAIGAFELEKWPDGQLFNFQEFSLLLHSAIQIDWAFLFINLVASTNQLEDLQDQFEQSEVIIRLADDSYFYIYSREKNIIQTIAEDHNQTIKCCLFDELDIPY